MEYKYTQAVARYGKQFLEDTNLRKEDRLLIDKFLLEHGRNLSHATHYRYYTHLKSLLLFLDKPLAKLTVDDYYKLHRDLKSDVIRKVGSKKAKFHEGEPYSEASKMDLDRMLREVLRWYKKHASQKELVNILQILEEKPYKPDKNKMEDPDILTEQEIVQMIKATPSERDRALIAVLWESGARSAEIQTLLAGDISPLQHNSQDKGLIMKMRESKTMKRTIPLIESAPYLQEYLNHHSDAKNPHAPLWIDATGKQLEYAAMSKVVKVAAKRAKIKKRIYNHLIRHSRATYLANRGWSEAQLCSFFGWSIGSRQPATYIRRSGINLADKVFEMHGMKMEEGKQKAALLPQSCYFCKHSNPSTNEYCDKCHKPLDPTKIAEQEQTSADMINALVEAKLNQILAKHQLIQHK